MVWSSRALLRKYGRFMDDLRIYVRGGTGGMGYPRLGGEGGKGGDVWLIAHEKITLKRIKDQYPTKRFVAGTGANSSIAALKGASGKDCEVNVPPGISVTRDDGKVFEEQEHSPDSDETSFSQQAVDIDALRKKARAIKLASTASSSRPSSRTSTTATVSSHRDRSPVGQRNVRESDDSEGQENLQEGAEGAARASSEEEEEAPANPTAAMPPEERLADMRHRRLRRSAAATTARAIDRLIGATSEQMTALIHQGERFYQLRLRSLEFQERAVDNQERALQQQERALHNQEGALQLQDRALQLQERAVHNQEGALHLQERAVQLQERAVQQQAESIQEQRRLTSVLEVQTGLLEQMVGILRAAQVGRVGGEQESVTQRAIPMAVEEPSGHQGGERGPDVTSDQVTLNLEVCQEDPREESSGLFSSPAPAPVSTRRHPRRRGGKGGKCCDKH